MKPLPRRTFLKGMGAAVGLPFLEAMAPRRVRAQEAARPLRFIAFYVPNGIHMPGWTPATTGALDVLPPILSPLEPLKSDVLVLSGLRNYAAFAQGDGGGDHARGTSAFLTCAHPVKTEGADIHAGISVDQVAANAFATTTRFASLELGCEGGDSVGNCDSGYSCAYARNISWASPTTPLGKETNPRAAFDRLFAGFDPTATAEQIAKRKAYRLSILDFVREDATSLSTKLGTTDRRKLDEYLTGVRAIEQRLQTLETSDGTCSPLERPLGVPNDTTQYVQTMLDIVATAFQCDLTRVATFMLGNGGSGRSYDFLGVPNAHHEVSHHQDDADKQAQLQTIDTWEVDQLRYLLSRLAALDEGGESVLHRSAVFFSSEIEDGDSHSHANLPVLLAGQAGGAFQTGRHVRVTQDEPVANLFISILNAVGVPTTSFGDDGTGLLAGL